ncbi:YhjD/YihY/BrkB family envelope integrity protein, partial [Bordetella ansorpii]|uniref:YhjD/YihY/BrkB family envelope integrity protein n=1 Tax=Bordetella ansorpii TaxID=288768 RepID=UPI001F3D1A81
DIVSLAISFIPLILTGAAFSALFVIVPNRRVYWRDALVGGYGAALLLELMKAGFAYYLTRFPTYTVIYGTFATLPIFLLWLWLSWLSVLFGATVAASLPMLRLGRWEINRCAGAGFIDALNVLSELRRAQGSVPPGLSPTTLAKRLQLHHDELNDVLETLSDMGMVARMADQNWILSCDPHRTTVEPVFEQFLLDRRQRRVRQDPRVVAAAAGVLAGAPPSLEELAGQAHNTPHDTPDRRPAAVVASETGEK